MKHWSAGFVGIPYTEFGRERIGSDCWGLAVVIYKEQVDITLPDYLGDYASVEERTEISALVADAAVSSTWFKVSNNDARELDIAIFRRGYLDAHIGIVIAPGLMIHMREDDCAKVERFDQLPWKGRLTGIYRHFKMMENAQ